MISYDTGSSFGCNFILPIVRQMHANVHASVCHLANKKYGCNAPKQGNVSGKKKEAQTVRIEERVAGGKDKMGTKERTRKSYDRLRNYKIDGSQMYKKICMYIVHTHTACLVIWCGNDERYRGSSNGISNTCTVHYINKMPTHSK